MQLNINGNTVVNLKGNSGFDAVIVEAKTEKDFKNWAEGEKLACRFKGDVYVKLKLNDNYEVMLLDKANDLLENTKRIEDLNDEERVKFEKFLKQWAIDEVYEEEIDIDNNIDTVTFDLDGEVCEFTFNK